MQQNPGRIAQRESVPFTRERSKVRSLVRPPLRLTLPLSLTTRLHFPHFGGGALAPRRPQRWLDAAHARSVPADAPAVKPPRARLPKSGALNAVAGVMRPWLRFQTPAASRTEDANVLSEHRAGDGSGKKNGAEGFHFRHGFSPHSNREKIPAWEGRSATSTEREIRMTSAVHAIPDAARLPQHVPVAGGDRVELSSFGCCRAGPACQMRDYGLDELCRGNN